MTGRVRYVYSFIDPSLHPSDDRAVQWVCAHDLFSARLVAHKNGWVPTDLTPYPVMEIPAGEPDHLITGRGVDAIA